MREDAEGSVSGHQVCEASFEERGGVQGRQAEEETALAGININSVEELGGFIERCRGTLSLAEGRNATNPESGRAFGIWYFHHMRGLAPEMGSKLFHADFPV